LRVPWIEIDPGAMNEEQDNFFKDLIFKSKFELEFSMDDILDAIAFDRCESLRDIINVLNTTELSEFW
jgi:hypothetical protein